MSRPYAAVFFDLDGTLIEGYMGDNGQAAHPFSRVVPLPGRLERLALLRQAGIKLGIASNQGGVGLGHQTRAQAEQKRIDVLAELDLWGHFVPLLMCYYHPNAAPEWQGFPEIERRKPFPGMLFDLAEHHKIAPEDCLFVGDRPEDTQAALNAGMDFCHADHFFSTEVLRPINDWPIPMREDRPEGQSLIYTLSKQSPRITGRINTEYTTPDHWADFYTADPPATTHTNNPPPALLDMEDLAALKDRIDQDRADAQALARVRQYRAHRIDSSENGPLGSPAPPRLPLDVYDRIAHYRRRAEDERKIGNDSDALAWEARADDLAADLDDQPES